MSGHGRLMWIRFQLQWKMRFWKGGRYRCSEVEGPPPTTSIILCVVVSRLVSRSYVTRLFEVDTDFKNVFTLKLTPLRIEPTTLRSNPQLLLQLPPADLCKVVVFCGYSTTLHHATEAINNSRIWNPVGARWLFSWNTPKGDGAILISAANAHFSCVHIYKHSGNFDLLKLLDKFYTYIIIIYEIFA